MAITDSRVVKIGVLKIPSGQNSSLDNASPASGEFKYISSVQLAGFKSVMVATPEDVLTGAVTVKVLYDHMADETAEASYVTLQSPPGTDVAIAAVKAVVLTELPFPAFIVQSAGTEADDVFFYVYGKRF